MPFLYEDYATLQPGDVVTVRFETKDLVSPSLMRKTLIEYNWTEKGLQLVNFKLEEKGGSVTLKLLPSFLLPLAWLAIATIVPSVVGLVGTLVKMWVVVQVANPLLAPGPLGLPMVFWLIIAAGGVAIPVLILMRKRK